MRARTVIRLLTPFAQPVEFLKIGDVATSSCFNASYFSDSLLPLPPPSLRYSGGFRTEHGRCVRESRQWLSGDREELRNWAFGFRGFVRHPFVAGGGSSDGEWFGVSSKVGNYLRTYLSTYLHA